MNRSKYVKDTLEELRAAESAPVVKPHPWADDWFAAHPELAEPLHALRRAQEGYLLSMTPRLLTHMRGIA